MFMAEKMRGFTMVRPNVGVNDLGLQHHSRHVVVFFKNQPWLNDFDCPQMSVCFMIFPGSKELDPKKNGAINVIPSSN